MPDLDTANQSRFFSAISVFVVVAAWITVAVGSLVSIGWFFDINSLKSLWPSVTSMKPNTAVAFIFAGFSLIFLTRAQPRTILSRVCASGVALIGAITLSQYLLGTDYGVDRLLLRASDSLPSPISAQGRMSILASTSFVFLGLALLSAGVPRFVRASQWMCLPVFLMGLLTLVSYFYGAGELVQRGYHHTLMAIHSAVLFTIMGLAIFLLYPKEGHAKIMTSDTLGGWIFRRIFPIALIVPLLVGWLQIVGEGTGYFDSAFRVAFMMVAMVPVIGVVLWQSARGLDRINLARHHAETRLEESQRSYRDQFMNSSVPMLMIDPVSSLILEANNAAIAFYGYTKEELASKSICDINTLPQEECRGFMQTVKDGVGGRFEFQHRIADGSVRDVAAYTSRVHFGGRVTLHSIIIDITDRKRAETELKNSEEKYRLLTDNNVSAVAAHRMIFDEKDKPKDYVFLSVNKAFETQTGLNAEAVVGRRVTEVLPGIEKSGFIERYARVVQTGLPDSFEEYSAQLDRYYHVNAYRLDKGCFGVVFKDITERKRAEEEQKEREVFLARLFETIPIPVFYKDAKGVYVLVNKAFETLFWKKKEELIGHTVFEVLPEKTAQASHAEDMRLMKEPGVHAYYAQVEDGMGVVHDVIFQKASVLDAKGKTKGVIGAILNITDQKHLEEELRAAHQRLEELEGPSKRETSFRVITNDD